MITAEQAILKISQFEKELTTIGGSTSIYWMGVEFTWTPLPLSRGGKLKRGTAYGIISYSCGDIPIVTMNDVITEITKPIGLKQALEEATALIECTMCGKIIIGKDALNAFKTTLDEYRTIDNMVHVIRTINDEWHVFTYTYKSLYQIKQLQKQLKLTPFTFEKESIRRDIDELCKKDIDYINGRMEITLCPNCMDNIYSGKFKEIKDE